MVPIILSFSGPFGEVYRCLLLIFLIIYTITTELSRQIFGFPKKQLYRWDRVGSSYEDLKELFPQDLIVFQKDKDDMHIDKYINDMDKKIKLHNEGVIMKERITRFFIPEIGYIVSSFICPVVTLSVSYSCWLNEIIVSFMEREIV